MRVFRLSERRFFLQFEHGEEIKDKLRAFADEHAIGVGVLRGLGAADRCVLDFYHLPEQRHESLCVEEATEVAGLVGNVTRGHDGRPIAHVHATLGRPDGSTLGGHVESLVAGATLEVDLEVFPGTLHRELDPRVGLHIQNSYETLKQ
jgi:predicted DNA-binding protein with PD1-like motif